MKKKDQGSSRHRTVITKRQLEFHPDRIMTNADEYREAIEWIDNQAENLSSEEDKTFLPWFEFLAKQKLRAAGFALKDKEKLAKSINILGFQGEKMISPNCGRIPLQNGFPVGTFAVSEDDLTFYVDIEIEAALRTLKTIETLRQLLVNNGTINREAMTVYLRTVELMINQMRTGHLGKLANRQLEMPEKGKEGGEKSGKVRKEKARTAKEAWQIEAGKIWKQHPTWGNSEVARMIVKKIGGNVGTIRKSIKRTLP